MWKNIVEPGRPQMTIWHMRVACWIPKATNTHSEYVILIDFPLQEWLHKQTWMLCFMYTAGPVIHCLHTYAASGILTVHGVTYSPK
jgi:hypothetical protein